MLDSNYYTLKLCFWCDIPDFVMLLVSFHNLIKNIIYTRDNSLNFY